MTCLKRDVRDEGNSGRVTDRGEETCEETRQRWVCLSPPGPLLVQTARRRTETSSKAGSIRRVSTTSQSRFRSVVQVKDALVQRNITLLSGEICTAWLRPSVAPTSRACPKRRNALTKVIAGGAEVSRGRSTDLPRPTEPGRTERCNPRRSHWQTCREGSNRRHSSCIYQWMQAARPQIHHLAWEIPQQRVPSSQP